MIRLTQSPDQDTKCYVNPSPYVTRTWNHWQRSRLNALVFVSNEFWQEKNTMDEMLVVVQNDDKTNCKLSLQLHWPTLRDNRFGNSIKKIRLESLKTIEPFKLSSSTYLCCTFLFHFHGYLSNKYTKLIYNTLRPRIIRIYYVSI